MLTNQAITAVSFYRSKFDIYDHLIESIPNNLVITKCVIGIHWTLIQSRGVGLAMSPNEGDMHLQIAGTITGKPVKEVAHLSKSWRPLEAAIGVAAINSWYNVKATIEKNWGPIDNLISSNSIFSEIGPKVAGKKVAVIGHFPDLKQLESICQLSILERKPLSGDLPDPACEYILPEQDFVFITGVTLINKTLPRLMELSRNAKIILVGPSVPLTPIFSEYNVSLLAGTTILDTDRVINHITEGGDRSIFKNGAITVRLDCNSYNQRNNSGRFSTLNN